MIFRHHLPLTLVTFCISQMMGTYAHATDTQAAKASDNEQQQEAKLHEELLEQQAKDNVDDDDDSDLVLNIDCCCRIGRPYRDAQDRLL